MKNKEYRRELRRLHGEPVAMVEASGAENVRRLRSRDTSGKSGTIKAITERVSPRVFRVIALSAPTERARSEMHLRRYVPHLPGAGDVVIFDRSRCNTAGVERVLGLLHRAAVPRRRAQRRTGHRAVRHHPDQVLARGERRNGAGSTSSSTC